MNSSISLPPHSTGGKPRQISASRQVTLIGANGAGKTRFMNYMVSQTEPAPAVLSAVSAFYPRRKNDPATTIDELYRSALPADRRDDTLPELDKLIQMLFLDEFRYLLKVKTEKLFYGKAIRLEPTRLDKMVELWQEIFPGNQIINDGGRMLFATESGTDLISTSSLSSGEKAVLYYIAGVLYAKPDSMVFIDNPSMFLHPAILNTLWNAIEGLRPDCTFVYNTSDMDFVNSRTGNTCVWVKSHDVQRMTWDYEILGKDVLPDDLFVGIMGTRRPVLFIEGDAEHSIDAKLYPLVFKRYTVRPLGSCNRVIETTRTFNDLKNIHKLESLGLVDRDRRTDEEVKYLRSKRILVPEVAEVENLFMVEEVIRIMCTYRRRNPDIVLRKVKKSVLKMFNSHFREQVLQHVRHIMKRTLERRADMRVRNIAELEAHLRSLPGIINVRREYDRLIRSFSEIAERGDYAAVLKIFNHKPMLPESQLPSLLGYPDKEAYIAGVLSLLREHSPLSHRMRKAMLATFDIDREPIEEQYALTDHEQL